LLQNGKFIGFIGLAHVDFQAAFTPAVDIGWRLAFDHWRKGYATEGALAVLRYGFEKLCLQEIVSFTAVGNMRSRAVMKKIGMHNDPVDDFDHPKLPIGHPLSRHVLYRISAVEWRKLLQDSLKGLEAQQ
jgi:RimJ/RimL family protein N-acetyltransferase